jgi:hypothetical protein
MESYAVRQQVLIPIEQFSVAVRARAKRYCISYFAGSNSKKAYD